MCLTLFCDACVSPIILSRLLIRRAMIIGCSESIIFKKQNQIRNFYFLFLIVYGYQLQKCADTARSCD